MRRSNGSRIEPGFFLLVAAAIAVAALLAAPAVAQATKPGAKPETKPGTKVQALPPVAKVFPGTVVASRCTAANADADGDGHRCAELGGDDCNDADTRAFPGNPEICDAGGHDEDCDPATFGNRDSDGDGYPDARCCNRDASGRSECGSDCDDARRAVHPDTPEVCNTVDDNCDGAIDDGSLKLVAYEDRDHDLFGSARVVEICPQHLRPGLVTNNFDCDDADPRKNPWSGGCP